MSPTSKRTLLDFQEEWSKLCDKGFNDFASLTADERVWFTVQALIGDVDNGGLIGHYYNSGANYNKETIEDLDFLGFSDLADLLRKINQNFPKGKVPKDLFERNKIIDSWDNGKMADFDDEQDNYFYKREKDLEVKLIDHISIKIVNS